MPSWSIGFWVARTRNGSGSWIGLVADGDLAFLHGLEESTLHFGGRAVDFIGKNDVREDRSEFRFEVSVAGIVNESAENIGGEKVGRELDAGKIAVEGSSKRFDCQCFSQSWNPFEENVAVGEKTGKKALNQLFLSDDDTVQFLADRGDPGSGLGDLLGEGVGIGHEGRRSELRIEN